MQNMGRMCTLFVAAALLTAGCATKGWVREYTDAQATEIDQRVTKVDDKVDQQAQQINSTGQRIDGMGAQITSLQSSVGDVKGLATAGQDRANAAYQKADGTNSRLSSLWDSRLSRTSVESIDVQFGFNRWDLVDAAQNNLAGIAKELKANNKLVVELMGYTDPVGPREHNVQLSQRRVEAVRRFFVQQGIDLWRIDSVGLGPIDDKGVSNDKKRRVTVVVMSLE